MAQAENLRNQDSPLDEHSPMRNARVDGDAARSAGDTLPPALAFLFLISFAGILECLKLSSLRDTDIWWHVRIGDWILENKAWPMSGLFSQASGSVWRDFNWGYDVVVALAFRLLGLRALPALLIAWRMAFAVISFLLAGGWRNFWAAFGLSVISQFLLLALGPGPGFVSLIFFGFELLVLLEVRDSGNSGLLFMLPVLFLFWANLDADFVYGIVLLLLFLGATLIEHGEKSRRVSGLERRPGKDSLRIGVLAAAGCLFATLLNPYGWNTIFFFLPDRFSLVNDYLPAFKASSFRQPQDYLLMLLTMAAFLSLGLRRSSDLFQISALVACTALAFSSRQEIGFLVVVSVAVNGRLFLPDDSLRKSQALFDWNQKRFGFFAGAATLIVLTFVVTVPRDRQALLANISQNLPVHAADFLRQQPQAQPLFNTYQWGGFLMWYLPEYPVAIDTRPELYSDEARRAYFRAINADIPYRDCPSMNQARTLLMEKGNVMGEALRGVKGFQLIYEDDLAVIYSRVGQR